MKAKKTYQEMKEAARQEAIEWQNNVFNHQFSYGEFAEAGEHFYDIGRRYGLLREFRENGIPC